MSDKDMARPIVALTNIEKLGELIHDIRNAPSHLPKIATFSGPSGLGKTFSCMYVKQEFDYAYLEIGASWGVAHLLDRILEELGTINKDKTIAKKMHAVIKQIRSLDTVLILDEVDHLVKPRALEVIREIHDSTGVPIVLVGEELLPKKLEAVERFHNRVLKWVSVEPANMEDIKLLSKLYVPSLEIADDLLVKVLKMSQGRVRRICVNLEQIKNEAMLNNWKDKIDIKLWGNKKLFTGSAPAPRRI